MDSLPSIKVPKRRYYLNSGSLLISSMLLAHEAESASGADTVLSYRIPDFQRPGDRWNRSQQIKFIESVYLGANIGSFIINYSSMHETNNLLLDGLQRLTALKAYLRGEFAVCGEDGIDRTWLELKHEDQRHLGRTVFPMIITNLPTRNECIECYDRHNYSGTPHTDVDRARAQAARDPA